MLLTYWLLHCLILLAHSKVFFEHVKITDNPKYVKSSYYINNTSSASLLNWNITIYQKLNLRITVRVYFYQFFLLLVYSFQMKTDVYILPNTKNSILPIPKLNYCDIGYHSKNIPFFSDIYRLIAKYQKNDALTQCPLEKGFYRLENILIDDKSIEKIFLFPVNTRAVVQFLLQDENGARPEMIYKYRIAVRLD
jgi:hypothetical protein